MSVRSLLRLSWITAFTLTAACGDDKGESTTESTGTTTTTTMGTTTATTDSSGGSTSGTTVGPVTGSSTTDPTGGPGGGMFCLEECTMDKDCQQMGMDLGLTCQAGVCTGDFGGCSENIECVAMFSGWALPCSMQMPCPTGVCVDVAGEGKCATQPGMGIECAALNQEEIMATPLGGGPDVTVCGSTSYECRDSVCTLVCKSDTDCNVPGLPKCNVGTGACECGSDDDCVAGGVQGQVVCKTSYCGCGSDADCSGNADTCYDGACGCSSDAACMQKLFDGTTISCKSP